MDKAVQRYLLICFSYAFGAYLAVGLIGGGWKDASVWKSANLLMLGALLLWTPNNTGTATIYAQMNRTSKLAWINLAFRFGLLFGTMMLLVDDISLQNRLPAVFCGVLFGLGMGYIVWRFKETKETKSLKVIYNVENPIPSQRFGALLYFGFPLVALALIVIGPITQIFDNQDQWLRIIVFFENILVCYGFNPKANSKIWQSTLLFAPTLMGLALLLASKYV